MVIITANEALQTALAGIAEKAEIRDPAGKLIGYFETLAQKINLRGSQGAF